MRLNEGEACGLIGTSHLIRRFLLGKSRYLCDRFEKAPNVTEKYAVLDFLVVCYGTSDELMASMFGEVLRRMYRHVKSWFGYRGDIAIELWVAPTLEDLQFMTGMSCADGYACAPGTRDGANIILVASPLIDRRGYDEARFSAVLAHEICHHFVADISRSTPFTMKRRENMDVPMWLEEGLAMVVTVEACPSFQGSFKENIPQPEGKECSLEDMWDDLSECQNAESAYRQAYQETKALIEGIGKAELIRLLYLNRTHQIDWNLLSRGGKALAKPRYTKENV